MRLYIAGPMSGIKAFNYPAFDRMADMLRKAGHDPVNPAEMDDPESRAIIMQSANGDHRDLPPGESFGYYIARDLKMLFDDGIQGIVVLPGWEKSRGARMETFAAKAILGLPVLRFVPNFELLAKVHVGSLVKGWLGGLWSEVLR